MSEYRQDDRTLGYCPRCGQPLSTISLTEGARGYCEQHGWQYANWYPTIPPAVRASNRDPGDETRQT